MNIYVAKIYKSILSFQILPYISKNPKVKRIMVGINSHTKELKEQQYLLEHLSVEILTDSTTSYVEFCIIYSNPATTPHSIFGCIVTPDRISARPTSQIMSTQPKDKFAKENIPLPVNGSDYYPLEFINVISNYKGLKKSNQKYHPTKLCTCQRSIYSSHYEKVQRDWYI